MVLWTEHTAAAGAGGADGAETSALSLVLYQFLFYFQELSLPCKIHTCFIFHFIKIRTAYEFEVRRRFTANNS